MFTYTAIFLVSLLVAVVARAVYKSMSNAGASVYSTKLSNAELVHAEVPVKHTATTDEGTDTAYPTDLRNRGTYAYLADPEGQQVAEAAPENWLTDVDLVPVDTGAAKEDSDHCSLFEVGDSDFANPDEQTPAPAQRKAKPQLSGKPYRVTDKVAVANTNLETDAKPWGW